MTKAGFEISRIAIDWSPFLDVIGSTIVASMWIVAAPASATVEVSGAEVDGAVSSILVTGAAAGDVAILEDRSTFQDGSREVFRLQVVVAGRDG